MNTGTGFRILGVLGFVLSIASPGAIAANESVADVRLVIENTAKQPIRCIAIVAHFLTKDIGTIEANGTQSIGFELYKDGGLAQGSFKGKAVFIENLRCGADVNWTETSADIPLDLLREDDVATVTAQCTIADRVTCLMSKELR